MKFSALLIFVVIVCGDNSSNFYDFLTEQEELFLGAICRSFCKHKGLSTCVDDNCTCKGETFNVEDFRNLSVDFHLKKPRLRCKDEDRIHIFWETEEDYAYFIEVSPNQGQTFYDVALCNSYTIKNLTEDTLYKIHLWSISYSKKEVLHSDVLKVRSLKEDFVLSPVEYLKYENLTFAQNQTEGPYKAVVTWGPNKDYSCTYDLVILNHKNTAQPKQFNLNVISDSYQHEIQNLEFDSEYNVSIRASTTMQESEVKYLTISIPACRSIYSNSTDKCFPEEPRDLTVNETNVEMVGEKSIYDVNISWAKPNWAPTYYNVCVANVTIPVLNNYTPTEPQCRKVEGGEISVVFKKMELLEQYHVVLGACSVEQECIKIDVFCNHLTCNDNTLNSMPGNLIPIDHLWSTLRLVLITTFTLATIIIIIIVIIFINRHRAKQGREEKRYKYFTELEEKVPKTINNLEIDLIIKRDQLADQWELETNKLHFQSVLGEGAFGIVRRACLEMKDGSKMEVAIKMLKNSPSSEEIRQFTQEIEIMKSVRQHPYIVSLIGCITRGLPEGPLLVVEYCSRGDLQTYLRAAWDKFSNRQRDVIYMENDSNTSPNYFSNITYDFHNINHDDEFIVQPKHLLNVARQVALGMEHLAKMHVVHRDLAARNVLVCENHTVKVSDFGLSRDVYQDNVYCKSGGGKLPIRWMALESLTHQRYTTQSDVWSFGILLWEIVTLGGTPYVGIHSCDLLDLLKRGYRLKCPATCHLDLYTIMQNCWKASPKDRPTFSELCKSLEILLENISQYLHVENEEPQPMSIDCDNLKSTKVSNDISTYERYIKPIGSTFK